MKATISKALPVALLAASLILAGTAMAQEEAFQAGMNYFKSGKYVEAASEFEALVTEAPSYDYGYFMLGNSYLMLGKTDPAVKNFKEAINLNGEKYVYHDGLAKAYLKSRQHRMVVETLNGAESIVPDRYKPAFFTTRGLSYYALKKWSEAIGDLEKAKALKPTEAVLSSLGVSYYKMGHHDKAAKALKSALAKDPKSEINNQLLSEALMEVGKGQNDKAAKAATYNEALAAAERVQAMKPGNFDAVNLVGRAALGAGAYSRAESSFQEALKLKPDYCFAMVNLAKTRIALENWKGAEESLRKADSCKPNNVLVHESLGFVLRKQKRLQESLQSYEAAYKLKPSASIKKAIDEVKTNIEIEEHNKAMDDLARQQEEEKRKAEEEFRAAQQKLEEYKKKTEDN